MAKFAFILLVALLGSAASASWYWPFGSDTNTPPRLATLMLPASTNIDAAADFMAEGRTAEALVCYRTALKELAIIENADPERSRKPEFASVRTKRAYVSAAIDAIETQQARSNVRPVVTTNTSELELAMKNEAEIREALRKADETCRLVLTRRMATVTNHVTVTNAASKSVRIKSVVTNQLVVVTNKAACADALARYGRIIRDIDALSSGRRGRSAQTYFAYLSGSRKHAVRMTEDLKSFTTKVSDEGALAEEHEKGVSRAAPPPLETSQFSEWKAKHKAHEDVLDKRAKAAERKRESEMRIREELEENPDGRTARLIRAGQALRKKDAAGARRELDVLLKKNPDDASALNLLAASHAVEKKTDLALETYVRATQVAPEDYHAYYNLARLRLGKLGDKEGARRDYARGLKVGGPRDEALERGLK